jgi:hypothetical protein
MHLPIELHQVQLDYTSGAIAKEIDRRIGLINEGLSKNHGLAESEFKMLPEGKTLTDELGMDTRACYEIARRFEKAGWHVEIEVGKARGKLPGSDDVLRLVVVHPLLTPPVTIARSAAR